MRLMRFGKIHQKDPLWEPIELQVHTLIMLKVSIP